MFICIYNPMLTPRQSLTLTPTLTTLVLSLTLNTSPESKIRNWYTIPSMYRKHGDLCIRFMKSIIITNAEYFLHSQAYSE